MRDTHILRVNFQQPADSGSTLESCLVCKVVLYVSTCIRYVATLCSLYFWAHSGCDKKLKWEATWSVATLVLNVGLTGQAIWCSAQLISARPEWVCIRQDQCWRKTCRTWKYGCAQIYFLWKYNCMHLFVGTGCYKVCQLLAWRMKKCYGWYNFCGNIRDIDGKKSFRSNIITFDQLWYYAFPVCAIHL